MPALSEANGFIRRVIVFHIIPLQGWEGRTNEIEEEIMTVNSINLREKLGKLTEYWQPKIIAQMNDYHVKIAKLQGDFIWHSHPVTDELFLVVAGELRIDFRDGMVTLKPGEMCVVPNGVEHKPFAEEECSILMVELAGTLNTGDAGGERTVQDPQWI